MITLTNCPQLSATEHAVLERFAAQAPKVLGDKAVSLSFCCSSRARDNARLAIVPVEESEHARQAYMLYRLDHREGVRIV